MLQLNEEIIKWYHLHRPFLDKNQEIDICDIMNVAASHGQIDIIKQLIDVTDTDKTYAMNLAAEYGYLEIVKLLHDRNERCCSDGLYMAAMNGHLDVVKWLHENENELFDYTTINRMSDIAMDNVHDWIHANEYYADMCYIHSCALDP